MTANKPENYRILIIDDDVDLNSLLTEYLQRFGHKPQPFLRLALLPPDLSQLVERVRQREH